MRSVYSHSPYPTTLQKKNVTIRNWEKKILFWKTLSLTYEICFWKFVPKTLFQKTHSTSYESLFQKFYSKNFILFWKNEFWNVFHKFKKAFFLENLMKWVIRKSLQKIKQSFCKLRGCRLKNGGAESQKWNFSKKLGVYSGIIHTIFPYPNFEITFPSHRLTHFY